MNLMSMINISDNRKERKAPRDAERAMKKTVNGYSQYKALEFNNRDEVEMSFEFKMELLRAYMR